MFSSLVLKNSLTILALWLQLQLILQLCQKIHLLFKQLAIKSEVAILSKYNILINECVSCSEKRFDDRQQSALSISNLLSQAIKSGDDGNLNGILFKIHKEFIIRASVEKLQGDQALKLLKFVSIWISR